LWHGGGGLVATVPKIIPNAGGFMEVFHENALPQPAVHPIG
jgi:hypothetical protein